MTGALLSPTSNSAVYADPADGAIVFATAFSHAAEDPVILRRSVVPPNRRKLAKVKQLLREVDEEEREEEEREGAPKKLTWAQKVLIRQPFSKWGWRHRDAKADVKRHRAETVMTLSDKGVLVSIGNTLCDERCRPSLPYTRRPSPPPPLFVLCW